MKFEKFFKWVEDRWGFSAKPDELLIIGLGIGGKAGEVQEQIKKHVRDDNHVFNSSRELKLVRELGDVLHYWCRICQHFNIDPVYVMEENINKLTKRDKEREEQNWLKGHAIK